MLSQPRFAYLPVGGLAHRFAATRAAAVEHHTAPPAWRWPTGVAVATGAAVATNSRNTNKQQALLQLLGSVASWVRTLTVAAVATGVAAATAAAVRL